MQPSYTFLNGWLVVVVVSESPSTPELLCRPCNKSLSAFSKVPDSGYHLKDTRFCPVAAFLSAKQQYLQDDLTARYEPCAFQGISLSILSKPECIQEKSSIVSIVSW